MKTFKDLKNELNQKSPYSDSVERLLDVYRIIMSLSDEDIISPNLAKITIDNLHSAAKDYSIQRRKKSDV